MKNGNFVGMMKTGILDFIEKQQLFNLQEKVIVAVSGGIDSMVLMDLLQQIGVKFMVAHCNFGLRGIESDGDELFVQSVANKYKVRCLSKCFETTRYAASKNISIQIAARELRYAWFDEIARKESVSTVLLAHHADDVAETMLINLCRGTGLAGLHGILPRNGLFGRPLLFAQRAEIEAYATEHHVKYREDSTNKKDKYTRNNIRHHVIPALKKSYPEAVMAFNKSAAIIVAQERVYRKALQDFEQVAVVETAQHKAIRIEELLQFVEPEVALFEVINPYGFNSTQVADLLQNITGQSGAKYLSPTHQLVRDRNFLYLTPLEDKTAGETYQITTPDDTCHLPITLMIEQKVGTSASLVSDDPNAILVDEAKLVFPMTLRKWQQGDWFQPIGMKGKKKVSDFFQDMKIPSHLKSHIYILESNGQIVWIVGYRMSDWAKITSSTKQMLKISVD